MYVLSHNLGRLEFQGTSESARGDEADRGTAVRRAVAALEDTACAGDACLHGSGCGLPMGLDRMVAYAEAACTVGHKVVADPDTSEATEYCDGKPCTCSDADQ